jgi:hypothetical protein
MKAFYQILDSIPSFDLGIANFNNSKFCSDNASEVFQKFISIWSNIFTDLQK